MKGLSSKLISSYAPAILIAGSSHAQFGVSPEIIFEKLNTTALNIAYGGGANMGLQLTLLKKIVKERKLVPKTVILGVDVFSLNDDPVYSDELQTAFFNEPVNYKEFISKKILVSYCKLYSGSIPGYIKQLKGGNFTLPYFTKNRSYNLSMFSKFEKIEISETGWVKGYGILNKNYIRYGKTVFNPSKKAVDDLNEYVLLCKSNHIQLIFIQIPEHAVSLAFWKKYEDFDKWMNQYSKQNDCFFWNFNSESSFPVQQDSLFFDSDHLNRSGAELFSSQLCNSLRKIDNKLPAHEKNIR